MNTIRDIIYFMKLMGFENKTGLGSSELEQELVDQWYKFRQYGPRNAGEKWCIQNRHKYGFRFEKHDPLARCECQRNPSIRKTPYAHQCTSCKCKDCIPQKNRYLGFPDLQSHINAIGVVFKLNIKNNTRLQNKFKMIYCKERLTGVSARKSYRRTLLALIDLFHTEIEIFVAKDRFRRRVIMPLITEKINSYSNFRRVQQVVEMNATLISWRMTDRYRLSTTETDLLEEALYFFNVYEEIESEILELQEKDQRRYQEAALMEQEDLREIEHSKKRVADIFSESPTCLFCLGTIDHYLIACNNCKDSEGNHKMCSHYACMDQWYQHSGNVRCGYCRKEDYTHY